jgi:hypothetical protein
LPVSETCNLAVEPPTIRPSVPRNFDWARTFDYRQPKAPINERPLQAGNTSVLHGIRNDPKVQLDMLMTRVFKKGHDIDVQNEFDRLVAQLPADEQVAQHAAFERAKRSFTRTRVGTMPAVMLQSASGSGPFPAREGRAAAVTAWISPIGPIVEHPLSEVNEPIGSPETFLVTTSAPVPRIPVSTSCSEPMLLRPDQVRASLMPTPVSRVSANHEEHVEGSESAEITSPLEPVLRFTPRSVINIPPEPVVNVPVQASRDPLFMSPRAHASTSISPESKMKDLINQVKVELQGLKLWKQEAISQLDTKVLLLTCDRVVDSASMNKVHEDLTERFSQLQIHVDSLATTSYVDQVQANLTKLIPTIVQNRPLTDQVTREEITKVRDDMQKVRVLHM